jgi:gliding motility-associated-like protein
MKIVSCFMLLFLPFCAATQNVMLERQVVGTCAINGTAGGFKVRSAVGQPEHHTLQSSSFYLTEGFEQPLHYVPATAVVQLSVDECTGEIQAEITEMHDCLEDAETVVNWDDVEGTTIFIVSGDSVLLDVFGPPGCHYESTIMIADSTLLSIPCEHEFYQLITPNNDGANDGWIIDQIDEPEFAGAQVTIFNRWGMQVWSADNYDNATVLWTGLSQDGNDLPDGTYFYVVETSLRAYSGFVELQR